MTEPFESPLAGALWLAFRSLVQALLLIAPAERLKAHVDELAAARANEAADLAERVKFGGG